MNVRAQNRFLQIKKSSIAGKGVFAAKPIKKGQRIHVMRGKRMAILTMFRVVDAGLEKSADPLLIADDLYLSLNELSRAFNHSCNPNTYLRRQCTMVALRNIRIGQEITFDYATTMVDGERIKSLGHPLWTCRCKCGARNCVGIIDQFGRLPARRRAFYIRNRYAPDFVLKKFDNNDQARSLRDEKSNDQARSLRDEKSNDQARGLRDEKSNNQARRGRER